MTRLNLAITCVAILLVCGCGEGDSSDSSAPDVAEADVTDTSVPDVVATDTETTDPGPDPGSIETAPSCQDYCQGLMDKLFAPGGTQMEDLECLQQNVGTPPAFDLDCLMGAANPTYEGCLECYTGEVTGEATCAALVAACL